MQAHYWGTIDPSRWKSRVDDDKYVDMKAYGDSKIAQVTSKSKFHFTKCFT